MVWQVDLSGKCIVVTGGNRVSFLNLIFEHQLILLGNWSINLSSMCSRFVGVIFYSILGQALKIILAGAHVAIIYRASADAPDVAKAIAEKYDVRCVVRIPKLVPSMQPSSCLKKTPLNQKLMWNNLGI